MLPRLLLAISLSCLSACAPDPQALRTQALETAAQWFGQAAAAQGADASNPPSCHAFGLVKFNDASCEDMIFHAAKLDAASREIDSVEPLECFGQGSKEVCGEFVRIWFNTLTKDDVGVREGMVLKRDNEQFRMYWYRSDTLFTTITNRAEQAEAATQSARMASKQEQLQAVYTQIVERDPGVYTFPACIDARVSSSAMVGELMAMNSVTTTQLEALAQQCDKNLCLALVGKRIAALCL